jgi:hypothetical protein
VPCRDDRDPLTTRNNWDGQIEKNKMDGACRTYWERRGAYWVFVGKLDIRRQLRRPRHCWKDNIKMDLQYVGGAWTGLICLRIGTCNELL